MAGLIGDPVAYNEVDLSRVMECAIKMKGGVDWAVMSCRLNKVR